MYRLGSRKKRTAAILLVCAMTAPAPASTYYVSASGNNANSGLSSGSPLKSLAAAAAKVTTGDTVLLNRGDVFRESVTFGNNISFNAYGNTSQPLPSIRGSDLVTGWTPLQNNIYVANFSGSLGQLYVNQQLATLARFPNEGWLRTVNFTENTTTGANTVITTNSLASHPRNTDDYWNGANIRWHRHSWWFETRTVTDYAAGGQISLADNSLIPIQQTDKSGWGFYLDNKLEELDSPGEYFYDSTAGKLYLMAPNGANPNTLTVEASVRGSGLQLNTGTVRNLAFAHQKTSGLTLTGPATVENSQFNGIGSDAGGSAISGVWGVGGSQIRNNLFNDNLNVAINWNQDPSSTSTTVIERNTLNNTGTVAGYGGEGSWHAAGIIIANGAGVRVQYNRINGTGYAGVIVGDDGNFVEYNVIDNAMRTLNDGAAIYSNASYTTIRNNIIRNTRGGMESSGPWENLAHGIWPEFLANYHHQLIENNTVVNSGGFGIYFDDNYDSIIRKNVLWASDRSQLDLSGDGDPTQRNLITANVFVAGANEELLRFRYNMNYGDTDGNYYLALTDQPEVIPFDQNWLPQAGLTFE